VDDTSRLRAEVNAKRAAVLSPAEEQTYRALRATGREQAAQSIKRFAADRFALESRVVGQMNQSELRQFSAALDKGDEALKLKVMTKTLLRSSAQQPTRVATSGPER
jgi:hypothetical protein